MDCECGGTDSLEATIEEMSASSSKKNKGSSSSAKDMQSQIDSHTDHITKLEQLLRLMDNNQLSPDDVRSCHVIGFFYFLCLLLEERGGERISVFCAFHDHLSIFARALPHSSDGVSSVVFVEVRRPLYHVWLTDR